MLNIFKKRKKGPTAELEKLLGNYELPSFPVAIMNVLAALRTPEFSMNKIAKLLESDPGIHVKILKTVNSAAFGLSTRVNNIHHAVTLLGRSRLETIVLSQAVRRVLPEVNLSYFDMRQFWLSSARRASLARVLAHHLHPATQVECFTAGLLQDMALPILVTVKREEYKTILERWNSDKGSSLKEIEREYLEYDHSSVGAMIAAKWNLPEFLITAISGHHGQEGGKRVEPAIELVSHIRGDKEEDAVEKLVESCVEKYGMQKESVLKMAKEAFDDAEKLSKILR